MSRIFPKFLMEGGEDVIQLVVSLTLIGIAGAVLFESIRQIFTIHPLFPSALLTSLNNVLFVVIILEILRTITAHFGDGGFQVGPFLVIGIIANVRHILTISASPCSTGLVTAPSNRPTAPRLTNKPSAALTSIVRLD